MRRRPPRIEFVQVANAVVRDYRLSWRARGLLVELLSYPPGYEISIDDLVKRAKRSGGKIEGRDAMRAAARELKQVGYIVETKGQDDRGRWWTELEVTDDPMWQLALDDTHQPPSDISAGHTDDGFPVVGEPGVGFPVVGEPGVSINTEKNTEKKEGEEGDARARVSEGSVIDLAGGSVPAGGVAGRRRLGATLAARDLVAELAQTVLPQGESITDGEWAELAALVDAARPVVEAHPVLDWESYTAYLRQGWWTAADKPRFDTFVGVLRARLSAAHIRDRAVRWWATQRAAAEPGPAGGREAGAAAETWSCPHHPGAGQRADGECSACWTDREGWREEDGRQRIVDGQEPARVDVPPPPPPVEDLAAELETTEGSSTGAGGAGVPVDLAEVRAARERERGDTSPPDARAAARAELETVRRRRAAEEGRVVEGAGAVPAARPADDPPAATVTGGDGG